MANFTDLPIKFFKILLISFNGFNTIFDYFHFPSCCYKFVKSPLKILACKYSSRFSDKFRNSGFAFKSVWWQEKGIPVIKIKNINQDFLDLNECSYVSEDKN